MCQQRHEFVVPCAIDHNFKTHLSRVGLAQAKHSSHASPLPGFELTKAAACWFSFTSTAVSDANKCGRDAGIVSGKTQTFIFERRNVTEMLASVSHSSPGISQQTDSDNKTSPLISCPSFSLCVLLATLHTGKRWMSST